MAVAAAAVVSPSRPSDHHSVSATLRVSVTVVASCAIATHRAQASVHCSSGVPQPIQRLDADRSTLTIDF